MVIIRIKLKKDVKSKKKDEIAHATRQQLKDLKLEPGKDYEVIGTPPTRVEPDLDKPAPGSEAPKNTPANNTGDKK